MIFDLLITFPHMLSSEFFGQALSNALNAFKNEDIIQKFLNHPKFEKIPPKELGSILFNALHPENNYSEDIIQKFLNHPNFGKVPFQSINQALLNLLNHKHPNKYDKIIKFFLTLDHFQNISLDYLYKMLCCTLKNHYPNDVMFFFLNQPNFEKMASKELAFLLGLVLSQKHKKEVRQFFVNHPNFKSISPKCP